MGVHGRVEGHGKGVLHKQQGLFGDEKSSSGSKDMLIEERRRPGSARARKYQAVQSMRVPSHTGIMRSYIRTGTMAYWGYV